MPEGYRPRHRVEDRAWQHRDHGRMGFLSRPGHQEILAGADDAFGNRRDLGGCFPDAENHLGKALSDAAMVVDLGKSEIFVGCVAQKLKEPPMSGLRR